jgi:hypothetical protein
LAKKARREPYLATYDWLCALENALREGVGHGLSWYKNTEADRAVDDDFRDGEIDSNNILTITVDEEQKQLRAIYFLQRCLHLNVERLMPPFHSRNNACVRALHRAGVWEVALLAIFQRNCVFGPFKKSGNFQQLWETGLDLSEALQENNPFLLRVWPSICKRKGWQNPSETDAQARVQFIKQLPTARPFAKKGMKVSQGKWMGIFESIGFEREDADIKLLGVACICLQKGWIDSWDGLLDPRALQDIEALKECEYGGGDALPPPGPGAASSSTGPMVPAVPAPKAKAPAAKAAARSNVGKFVQRSEHALLCLGRLLANVEYRDMLEVLHVLYAGIWKEHVWAVHLLKGSKTVKEYYLRMALGEYLKAMYSAIECTYDIDKFRFVFGFTLQFTRDVLDDVTLESPRVAAEDALAAKVFRILSHLLTEAVTTSMRHSSYPMCFAAIYGNDGEREECMANFRKDWEAYVACRAVMLPSVRALARRSPLNTRAWELMARYAKAESWRPTDVMLQRADILFDGLGQERLLEDTLKEVRDSEWRDSTSRAMKVFRIWEVPVLREQLRKFNQDEIDVDPTIHIANKSDNYESMFLPTASVADELRLADVRCENNEKNWDTFTPQALRAQTLDLPLMRKIHEEYEGKFELVDECWRSMMIPLHHLILRRPAAPAAATIFYSIQVTASGCLGWPVKRLSGTLFRLVGVGAKPITQIFMSFDDVFVVPFKVISPLHAYMAHGDLKQVSILGHHTHPEPLLEYQARRGFAGVPESALMHMFGKHFKQPTPDPPVEATEVDTCMYYAAELANMILPDLPVKDLEMALRSWVEEDFIEAEELFNEVVQSELLEDCVKGSDRKEVKSHMTRRETRKRDRVEVLNKVEGIARFVVDKRPKAPKKKLTKAAEKAKAATIGGDGRWWASIPGDYSYVQGLLPSVAHCFVDDANGRYVVTYRAQRKSYSWTQRGVVEAARLVLRTAWQWHELATGEVCPHTF